MKTKDSHALMTVAQQEAHRERIEAMLGRARLTIDDLRALRFALACIQAVMDRAEYERAAEALEAAAAREQALRTALEVMAARWLEAAKQADRLAAEFDAKSDGANSHAFRKERRIWMTCADELRALVLLPAPPEVC